MIEPRPSATVRRMSALWTAVALVTFALTAGAQATADWDPIGVLGWLVAAATGVALVASLAGPLIGLPAPAGWAATAVALLGWTTLVLQSDGWTLLMFAVYAVALSSGPRLGIWLAAYVSAIWALAWLIEDAPGWVLLIPLGVFVTSSVLAATITRIETVNHEQADLIEQLDSSRAALAASERQRGTLEERERMAAEIHDTLAQGFTSIVLLSRAGQRGEDAAVLPEIERTALDHLDAARRLVDALHPAELDQASLPDAIARQLRELPTSVAGHFHLSGEPRQLAGALEVVALRGVQEALTNAITHAAAARIDVTMSYMPDLVALDVRDDGIGFASVDVADRGELTGGQGLRLLRQRAEAVGGVLTIESSGGGSVVSLQLPIDPPNDQAHGRAWEGGDR